MSGLAVAVHQILEAWPHFVQHTVPALLDQFVGAVGVPVAVAWTLLALVGWTVQRVRRTLYPPGPGELHRSALLLLHQSTLGVTVSKRQERKRASLVQTAMKLLRQASVSRPRGTTTHAARPNNSESTFYAPAVLSLAAIYVYKLEDGPSAIQWLESTLLPRGSGGSGGSDTPTPLPSKMNVQDAWSIRLDAQALVAGHGHMIQRELRHDEFLALSYCDTSAPDTLASKTTLASKKTQ